MGGFERRFRASPRGARLVDLLGRYELLSEQWLDPVKCVGRLLILGVGAADVCPGCCSGEFLRIDFALCQTDLPLQRDQRGLVPLQHMLIGNRVDREQHVALAHHLVVLHLEIYDAAAYLWCDADHVRARERVVGARILVDEIDDVRDRSDRRQEYGESGDAARDRSPA